MPRFDKYEPLTGGFRAALGFAPVTGDVGAVIAVGINTSGKVVKGSGNTGVIGVICMSRLMNQGDVVDIMQDGEIVDMTDLTAGTKYYGSSAGAITTTNTDKKVGFTVESDRLVVRVGRDIA